MGILLGSAKYSVGNPPGWFDGCPIQSVSNVDGQINARHNPGHKTVESEDNSVIFDHQLGIWSPCVSVADSSILFKARRCTQAASHVGRHTTVAYQDHKSCLSCSHITDACRRTCFSMHEGVHVLLWVLAETHGCICKQAYMPRLHAADAGHGMSAC
jgi:hypothetical protein